MADYVEHVDYGRSPIARPSDVLHLDETQRYAVSLNQPRCIKFTRLFRVSRSPIC